MDEKEADNNSHQIVSSRFQSSEKSNEYFSPAHIENSIEYNSMASAPFPGSIMKHKSLVDAEDNGLPSAALRRTTTQILTKKNPRLFKNLNESIEKLESCKDDK